MALLHDRSLCLFGGKVEFVAKDQTRELRGPLPAFTTQQFERIRAVAMDMDRASGHSPACARGDARSSTIDFTCFFCGGLDLYPRYA